MHPYGEKSPISKFLKNNKTGSIHHICIGSKDIKRQLKNSRKIELEF